MAQRVELNFRDYWRIVRKRRWVIIASVLICTLASLFTIRKETPIYQASAKIKVEQRKTLAGIILESSVQFSPGDPMENYARIIEGRPVAEGAAKRAGLLKPEMTDPEKEAAIDEVQGAVSTERVVDTNLIGIMATHEDPQKAKDIANAVAESFVEWDLSEKNKQARKTREFIEAQLEDVQKKLHDLEDRLTALKIARPTSDPASPLTAQLATLKAELSEFSTRATEKHPRIVLLKEQIQKLEGQISQIPGGGGGDTEYTRLVRDVTLHEQLYTLFKQKFEEARISEAEKVSDISIVDYARLPSASLGGGKTMNTFFGGMIGLLLGFVIAFVTENLDTSMNTIEDVETLLTVPVLAVVPHVAQEQKAAHFWERFQAKEFPEVDRKARMVVHNDPKSPIAESYRSLRTNLKFAGEMGRSLVITSTSPREGKTTVLVNLALTTAQMGSRTLLVESDLRRPSISRTFQIQREPGLSDVLSGATQWQECVRSLSDFLLGGMTLDEAAKTPGLDHLFILTGGRIPLNPAELLGSGEMVVLIEELRQNFDVILYDAPPVLPITDAALIAPKVDGTILVYEIGRTARSALVRAKSQIESGGGKVLGVVLNHIKAETELDSGYRYYYHYKYYGREKGEKETETGGRVAKR